MARIEIQNIERVEKERNHVHETVRATYTIFNHDGKKYFQIDTYGRSQREMPEKISQAIQLDETAVAELMALLQKEFG